MNMTDFVERCRTAIEQELDELRSLSERTGESRAPVMLDQQSVGRLSRMDAIQAKEFAAEADRRRKLQIARLTAALKRIEDGEFGYCAECGEPISEGRLAVDPAAHLCIDCARAAGV
jgi:DnaK suppressor protein